MTLAKATRSKRVRATTATDTLVATFAESVPLPVGYTLVAAIYTPSSSGYSGNSWGVTPENGGSNGSGNLTLFAITPSDGVKNSITVTLSSSMSAAEVWLMAFPGHVTPTPVTRTPSNGSSEGPSGSAVTGVANPNLPVIAIATWAMNAGSTGGVPTAGPTNGFVTGADDDADIASGRFLLAVNDYPSGTAVPSTSFTWPTARNTRKNMLVLRGTAQSVTPSDTTPPIVSINSPAQGATLAGTVTVSATATDDVDVTAVSFWIGDTLVGNATEGAANVWSLSGINTTGVPDGPYVLQARATDAAGNVGETEVLVTVANTPAPTGPTTPMTWMGKDISGVFRNGEPQRVFYMGTQIFGSPPTPIDPNPGGGGGATGAPERVVSHGPNGSHFPERTPWPGTPSNELDMDVEVACSWSAINTALATAFSSHPNGQCVIRVAPGALPGNGAGSTSAGVLANIGSATRPYRVLVVPRDGAGTVTLSNSISLVNVKGVSFVGIWGTAPGQNDANGYGVMIRECKDVSWSWSRLKAALVTESAGGITENIEWCEVVKRNSLTQAGDVFANRGGDTGDRTASIKYRGVYVAPSHKPAGSSAHCDTFQVSEGATHDYYLFEDSVLFGSTNAVVIGTGDGTVAGGGMRYATFDHTLLVGANAAKVRHPQLSGEYAIGQPVAVNGGLPAAIAKNGTIVIGKNAAYFTNITDSKMSRSPDRGGAWTIDGTLETIDAAWLNARAPEPSDADLFAMWDW